MLPNVGEAPNQPLDFAFPKHDFGKTKVVRRAFQAQWFTKWPWLHYDSGQDLAFCYTCVTAVASGKLKLSTGNVKDSVLSPLDSATERMQQSALLTTWTHSPTKPLLTWYLLY